MKAMFDQLPKLIDSALEKIESVESHGRPDMKEASNKLVQTMRQATKELAYLSAKYGQSPAPKKKTKEPVTPKKKEEGQQLSFDFMENAEHANKKT